MFKHIFCVMGSLFLLTTSAQSLPISVRTKVSCITDYYRFCNGWPNDELRKCFQINVLRVSNVCVGALVDEGLISKKEVDDMKRQAIAIQNAKPIVRTSMPPPINPNPTVADITKKSNQVKPVAKNKTVKKQPKPAAQPVKPVPKKVSPDFEIWKKKNGF